MSSLPTRVTLCDPGGDPLPLRVAVVAPNGDALISVAGMTFVWEPGSTTDTTKAIFGTWAEVLDAAQQVRPSIIRPRETGTPFSIPQHEGGGTWDMAQIMLDGGDQIGAGPTIYLEDGAQLESLTLLRNVTLSSSSTAPVIVADEQAELTLEDGAALRCDAATGPLIYVPDNGFIALNLRYFSSLYSSDPSAPVVYAESLASVVIVTDFAVQVYANTLDGPGSYALDDLYAHDAASRNQGIDHTQNASNIDYSYG